MRNESRIISELSKKHTRLQTLIHYVSIESLKEENRKMSPDKAVGIDGVTKEMYNEHLEENLENLMKRMKAFRYRPKPTRRVEIPKENGKTRILGISSYEDKLVEGVMADILSAVYEPRFHECSYGFRPRRSMHQAIAKVNHSLMFEKINYVIDCDIKGCFDNIEHKWLIKFLENDIEDRNFIRYVVRFLKSGIMNGNILEANEKGTKQGNKMSPVLANVFLHYVLDNWFESYVREKVEGNVSLIRFADDFIILCQEQETAEKIFEALPRRFEKFGLELNKEKSKILPFGRYRGTEETFDFLGFTFINGRDVKGRYRVHINTSKKKMMKCKREIKKWLTENMHMPIAETMKQLIPKIRGHNNYYGVSGNYRGIQKYYRYVKYGYYRILRRRGQKNPINYKDYLRIWEAYKVPRPKVCINIWY